MNKFTKEFKQKAIKLKEQGGHPNKIFEDEGIDISDKQKDYASKLISRWNTKKKLKKEPFTKEQLQILKKAKKFEEKKKIEYLEAKVAYLEAEKTFLESIPKKK